VNGAQASISTFANLASNNQNSFMDSKSGEVIIKKVHVRNSLPLGFNVYR